MRIAFALRTTGTSPNGGLLRGAASSRFGIICVFC
jgi:hypothetical protein